MEKSELILHTIFWILVFITLILLIWYMFGESPGIESLIAALFASEIALWGLMYKHGRELTKMKNTFRLMKVDIGTIKSDINLIKKDFKRDMPLIMRKLKIT